MVLHHKQQQASTSRAHPGKSCRQPDASPTALTRSITPGKAAAGWLYVHCNHSFRLISCRMMHEVALIVTT